jgi:hypothetical protein
MLSLQAAELGRKLQRRSLSSYGTPKLVNPRGIALWNIATLDCGVQALCSIAGIGHRCQRIMLLL